MSQRKLSCSSLSAVLVLSVLAAAPLQAKRLPPRKVQPLVVGNTEYRATTERVIHGGRPSGMKAFVEARDVQTQKLLWKVMVYEIVYKPGLETDIQDVHIRALAIDNQDLVVTAEKGRVYRIDLTTHKIKPSIHEKTPSK